MLVALFEKLIQAKTLAGELKIGAVCHWQFRFKACSLDGFRGHRILRVAEATRNGGLAATALAVSPWGERMRLAHLSFAFATRAVRIH